MICVRIIQQWYLRYYMNQKCECIFFIAMSVDQVKEISLLFLKRGDCHFFVVSDNYPLVDSSSR